MPSSPIESCTRHRQSTMACWVVGCFLLAIVAIYAEALATGQLTSKTLHISAVMDNSVRSAMAAAIFLVTAALFAWSQTCQPELDYQVPRVILAATIGLLLACVAALRTSQVQTAHYTVTIIMLLAMFALSVIWILALKNRDGPSPARLRSWPLLAAITAFYAFIVLLLIIDVMFKEPSVNTAVLELVILVHFAEAIICITSS